MRGYLGEKLIADLIRDIASHHLSGSLRISENKIIKALFFDRGAPVFAISNLPGEQLEHKLIKDRIVTPGLVESARQREQGERDKVERDKGGREKVAGRLGQILVEMGALKESALEQAVSETAAQVIKSLFEWEQGEYIFDESPCPEHAVRLRWTAADLILEGARHAADIKAIAARILPPQKLVAPAVARETAISHSANLNSSEGYVLSCVQYPISISELSAATGLAEQEARRAVCALVSLGALMMVEAVSASPAVKNNPRPVETSKEAKTQSIPSPPGNRDTETDAAPAQWMIEELTRKLKQFETANHYEVLGVDRLATTTIIRQSYYDLEMMFNSFRARWPAHHEVNAKLDSLFAKINLAYHTLSDLGKRRAYDMPGGKQPQTERGHTEPAPASKGQAVARGVAQAINEPAAQPEATRGKRPVEMNLKKVAAEKYLQGRALYEKRDFHTSAHLLREAVKLDPSRAEHHYHLALVLSILSQARHMHDGHEGCHVTCNMGGSLIRNQRVRYEALQHFQEAARLEPQNAQIRIKLGLLYKEAGMAKKAEACFWEALLLDGNNQIALQELGLEDKPEIAAQQNPLSKKDPKKKIS